MASSGRRPLRIVAVLCCVLATVAEVVSFAIPYWASMTLRVEQEFTIRINYGLWNKCMSIDDSIRSLDRFATQGCKSFVAGSYTGLYGVEGGTPDYAMAVFVLSLIGMFAGVAGLLALLVSHCNPKSRLNCSPARCVVVSTILTLIAGILIIVGVIVYGINMDDDEMKKVGFVYSNGLFTLGNWEGKLGGGFAAGAVAGALYILTTMLLFCLGRDCTDSESASAEHEDGKNDQRQKGDTGGMQMADRI